MQTNDLQVLGAMSAKNPRTSAHIAEKLGITPFQITARLASMEKRGLAQRVDKKWLRIVSVDEAKAMAEKSKRSAESSRGTIIVDMQDAVARRDSNVPILPNARGWKLRTFWSTGDQRIQVFTTVEGEHFVYAEPSEPADTLVDYRAQNIGLIRLRKFDTNSALYRRLYRERGRELAEFGYIS